MASRYTNRSNSSEDRNTQRQQRISRGSDGSASYRQGSSSRTTARPARHGAHTNSKTTRQGHSQGYNQGYGANANRGYSVNDQFDPTSPRYERTTARNNHASTPKGHHASSPSILRGFSPYHILIACIVVIIAIIVVAVCINGPRENTPQEDATPTYIENVSYTPHSTDLDSAPAASDGIATFSLIEGEGASKVIPTLTEEQTNAITYALDQIKAITPDVGFMILDIDTGAGICYNIDQDIYAASSFKGPYSVYVCESATSGNLPSSTRDNIHNAIAWSDNNSYYRLRNAYNGTTFTSWMEEVGVDPAKAARTFPTYNVRDLSKLWLHSYPYLTNTNDTKAQWLANELRNTEVSFLRDGIVLSGASDATVMNKGGWIIGSKNYNAVIDAGLVEDDGHHYLVSIMTALPDGEPREQLVSDLAATLYSIRGVLDQDLEDDATLTPYDAQKSKASAEAVAAAKASTSDLKTYLIERLKQTLPTYTSETTDDQSANGNDDTKSDANDNADDGSDASRQTGAQEQSDNSSTSPTSEEA